MQPYSLTDKIGRQTLDLHRRRLVCKLLRKQGLLSDNINLVLRFADHLLESYSYRSLTRE